MLGMQVLTLGLLFASSAWAALPGAADSVYQLNEDNFDDKVAQGLWFVLDTHSSAPELTDLLSGLILNRAFAPTYEKLGQDFKPLEERRGFHIGQVNCQAQGDLCNKHDIKFYPQIKLYQDGKELEQYSGDRTYETLAEYIENQSKQYVRSLGTNAARSEFTEQGIKSASDTSTNSEGIAKEVDHATFERLKSLGPVFVKFYAPCCKKLAPTWSELASNMKDKLHVVSVNCDDHKNLCISEGIKGYPTLRMYSQGTHKEHTKGRSLGNMQAFAEKYLTPGEVKHLDAEHWGLVKQQHNVYFVVLQTFSSKSTDLSSVKNAAAPYLVTSAFYETHDPEITDMANDDEFHGSILAVFKDGASRPTARLSLPASPEQISSFVLAQRNPTVFELDSGNFDDIMQSPTRPLVVLVALKKSGRAQGDLEKETGELHKIAKAWYRGGRTFEQPVWFAWIDGERYKKWLKQNYGIKHTQLPAVVLADPANHQYYDTTLERSKLIFEGSSVFSTLEGAYQHFLKPKTSDSTLEWGSKVSLNRQTPYSLGGRAARLIPSFADQGLTNILVGMVHTGLRHPILTVFIFICVVASLAYALHKTIQADLKQTGSRLD
ncbi:hypothetical protein QFC19_007141 [Naganishia cerealis]|uniref:Uncharacterized protein n=1 Tax=Naganishia cerealis TaxID=610337 RepID=A0ACC2VB71_9TREE|nr:hypothetical protein QFC19_007141 [Naganishia cerealis]